MTNMQRGLAVALGGVLLVVALRSVPAGERAPDPLVPRSVAVVLVQGGGPDPFGCEFRMSTVGAVVCNTIVASNCAGAGTLEACQSNDPVRICTVCLAPSATFHAARGQSKVKNIPADCSDIATQRIDRCQWNSVLGACGCKPTGSGFAPAPCELQYLKPC